MTNYDVFNGDADGICALIQLRLKQPESNNQLVTGIKRDIQLLKQLPADIRQSQITVLDVSLDKNRHELLALLDNQNQIFYADHHFPGEIPVHQNLTALIDTDSNICTSLIVNRYLEHQFFHWAIVGAFGDNLSTSAQHLCAQQQINPGQAEQFKELGILINYNGYGAEISDLYFAPDALFKSLLNYPNPSDYINDSQSNFKVLQQGYADDMSRAENTSAHYSNNNIAVFILPQQQWARRVSGVFGNDLANQSPQRAHAVLTPHKQDDGFVVSVRAPLNNKTGADELCRRFPSGGGRKAAAGINHLPEQELDTFIEYFNQQYEE